MSEKVKPQHFYTDTPPERIIGTECEYTVQNYGDSENPIPDDIMSDSAINAAQLSIWTEYLSNGGRLYIDGAVLEYASPECLGPRQAAAADLAGIEVVRKVVAGSNVEHNGVYRYASADVMQNEHHDALMPRKTTGYHENFMVPRKSINEVFDAVIPAHLASRLWAMSGILQADGYRFAQKLAGIGGDAIHYSKDNRRLDELDKPMVLIPPPYQNTDVSLEDHWARVEVRYADPGLSPLIRYLSLAATSLVLRLVEHADRLDNRPALEALRLKDPVEAARRVTDTLSLRTLIQTEQNQFVTATDISEMLAIQAEYLSRHIQLPADEEAAIPLWFDVIDLLRSSNPQKGDYGDLIKFSDFAARHHRLLARSQGKKLTSRNEKQIAIATNWDRIDENGTGLKWWEYFGNDQVPQSMIDSLVTTAPNTRAAKRAEFIKKQNDNVQYMTWAYYVNEYNEEVSYSDPYGK